MWPKCSYWCIFCEEGTQLNPTYQALHNMTQKKICWLCENHHLFKFNTGISFFNKNVVFVWECFRTNLNVNMLIVDDVRLNMPSILTNNCVLMSGIFLHNIKTYCQLPTFWLCIDLMVASFMFLYIWIIKCRFQGSRSK